MGKLNISLKTILDRHISPLMHHNVVLNSEQDVVSLIRDTGMINIDGCEINFKLNIKSILQYFADEGIILRDIRIVNSVLNKGISFFDVQIDGNLYFWENTCWKCDFSNLKVNGFSYFSNTIFKSISTFDHAVFLKDCFFWGVEFFDKCSLRNCEFQGRLDFWNAAFYNAVDFSHSTFKSDFDFSNTECSGMVLFKDTAFGNKENSSMSIFDNMQCRESVVFADSNFRSEVSICKSNCKKVLDITRCSINNTMAITDTVFSNLKMNYTHFYSPVYIKGAENVECIDLQNAWIDTILNIYFIGHSRIQNLSFNKTIFSKNSIVSIEGIDVEDSCEINFCNIIGVLSIYNSKINLVEANCSSVIGSLILKDTKINLIDLTNSTSTGRIITDSNNCLNPLNRETANILRHQKEKEGDVILSLRYKEIEMRRYKADFDKLSILEKIRNIDEIIIVKLNYWSNDYGQSWLRGVAFTLLVSFIFTILLSIINKEIGLTNFYYQFFQQDFWNRVIEFLWFPSVDEFKSKDLLYVITSLLGKIMVAYGIFQTAMSFRKYSKS